MGHIMAQVAVLQMNMEMRHVIAMKLKKQIRDFSYNNCHKLPINYLTSKLRFPVPVSIRILHAVTVNSKAEDCIKFNSSQRLNITKLAVETFAKSRDFKRFLPKSNPAMQPGSLD